MPLFQRFFIVTINITIACLNYLKACKNSVAGKSDQSYQSCVVWWESDPTGYDNISNIHHQTFTFLQSHVQSPLHILSVEQDKTFVLSKLCITDIKIKYIKYLTRTEHEILQFMVGKPRL